jgi:hypothetical protein
MPKGENVRHGVMFSLMSTRVKWIYHPDKYLAIPVARIDSKERRTILIVGSKEEHDRMIQNEETMLIIGSK